jgi:hypothetical protein
MDIQTTKLLLIDFDEISKRFTSIEYFESKFPRELGEKIRMDGLVYRVGAIADTKDELLKLKEVLVRKQNKETRRLQSIDQREAKIIFADMVKKAMQTLKEEAK